MLNVFEYMSKIQESIEEKNEGLGELYKISMMKLSNEVKPTSLKVRFDSVHFNLDEGSLENWAKQTLNKYYPKAFNTIERFLKNETYGNVFHELSYIGVLSFLFSLAEKNNLKHVSELFSEEDYKGLETLIKDMENMFNEIKKERPELFYSF